MLIFLLIINIDAELKIEVFLAWIHSHTLLPNDCLDDNTIGWRYGNEFQFICQWIRNEKSILIFAKGTKGVLS